MLHREYSRYVLKSVTRAKEIVARLSPFEVLCRKLVAKSEGEAMYYWGLLLYMNAN